VQEHCTEVPHCSFTEGCERGGRLGASPKRLTIAAHACSPLLTPLAQRDAQTRAMHAPFWHGTVLVADVQHEERGCGVVARVRVLHGMTVDARARYVLVRLAHSVHEAATNAAQAAPACRVNSGAGAPRIPHRNRLGPGPMVRLIISFGDRAMDGEPRAPQRDRSRPQTTTTRRCGAVDSRHPCGRQCDRSTKVDSPWGCARCRSK
jgi:hypothetical protein